MSLRYGPHVAEAHGDAIAALAPPALSPSAASLEVMLRVRELRDEARAAYDLADAEGERRAVWSRYEFYNELSRLSPKRIASVIACARAQSEAAGGRNSW